MYDPIVYCVRAITSDMMKDHYVYGFGPDWGMAEIEAMERCQELGLSYLGYIEHSVEPSSYYD